MLCSHSYRSCRMKSTHTHARGKSLEQLSVEWLVLQLIENAPDVIVSYLVIARLTVVAFVSVHVWWRVSREQGYGCLPCCRSNASGETSGDSTTRANRGDGRCQGRGNVGAMTTVSFVAVSLL